jgi:hypothetical protein
VYSLIAQRGNEDGLQISKFAAYESRISNIMGKESLKYGAAMRVIAAVTLGFLPGTFTATLFSASFWNFQPSNKGRVVSKWVWLYWVVTVVLTLAVLAAWRIISRFWTVALEEPPEQDLVKLPGIDYSGEHGEKEAV